MRSLSIYLFIFVSVSLAAVVQATTTDIHGTATVRTLDELKEAVADASVEGIVCAQPMKVTEEVDALRTLGVAPLEALALPKFFSLVIALPLLTVFADFMGVLGGMFMANSLLDISVQNFMQRLTESVSPTSMPTTPTPSAMYSRQ